MRKILFIDDNKGLSAMMKKIFVRRAYDFHFAYNGEDGLKKAVEVNPDIIVLDVALPDIDGFELCRIMKTNEEIKTIPVILVTGVCSIDKKVKGFSAGASDFITKPVDVKNLFARIDDILGKLA